MTSQGSRGYNTTEIISQLRGEILIALFADMLQLGNSGNGSFALADGKMGIVEAAIEFRLKEIADVLNKSLIPALFKANKWDDTDYPKFVFEDVSKISVDELSKAGQRLGAVSLLEKDREVLNIFRKSIGASALPDDLEPQTQYIDPVTSRAGDGMSSGLPSGTGDATGGGDTSTSNNENAA